MTTFFSGIVFVSIFKIIFKKNISILFQCPITLWSCSRVLHTIQPSLGDLRNTSHQYFSLSATMSTTFSATLYTSMSATMSNSMSAIFFVGCHVGHLVHLHVGHHGGHQGGQGVVQQFTELYDLFKLRLPPLFWFNFDQYLCEELNKSPLIHKYYYEKVPFFVANTCIL